jgi:hypothetical protein
MTDARQGVVVGKTGQVKAMAEAMQGKSRRGKGRKKAVPWPRQGEGRGKISRGPRKCKQSRGRAETRRVQNQGTPMQVKAKLDKEVNEARQGNERQ